MTLLRAFTWEYVWAVQFPLLSVLMFQTSRLWQLITPSMPSCVSVDRDESDMKRPTSSVYWSLIWLKAWWTGPFVVLIQNTSSPGQGISADDSMEVIRASWVRQQKYFKPYSGPKLSEIFSTLMIVVLVWSCQGSTLQSYIKPYKC